MAIPLWGYDAPELGQFRQDALETALEVLFNHPLEVLAGLAQQCAPHPGDVPQRPHAVRQAVRDDPVRDGLALHVHIMHLAHHALMKGCLSLCAGVILTKGLAGVAFVLLPVALFLAVCRRRAGKARWRAVLSPWGWVALLALALPWYLLMYKLYHEALVSRIANG